MFFIFFKYNIKDIKKINFIIVIIFILFGNVVFASNSSDKDNVLIYINKTGEARGYDLLWKAENITGTFAQESSVTRKDNIVYISSINKDAMPGNNDLFALDAYTGEIIDRYTIGPTFGDPTIIGTTLYIGTGDESWGGDSTWINGYGMFSFDISDVRNNGLILNWFHSVPERISPNILVDDDNVYFGQFEGTQYIALSRINGNVVWSFTKGNYDAAFELLHGDYIYLANSYSGGNILYKLNKIDGTEVWNKPIAERLWDNSITYSPDYDALFMTFYYDAAQHRAASYDMNGNERWTQSLNCQSLSFTSYHNNSVFFSDTCGWVYSLDPDTGQFSGLLKLENLVIRLLILLLQLLQMDKYLLERKAQVGILLTLVVAELFIFLMKKVEKFFGLIKKMI